MDLVTEGTDYTGAYISQVLDTVGVDTLEDLQGKPIRVDNERGFIKAIGNFLEDKWFSPTELFANETE